MGKDIRTYRARSMQEAIELVRRDLGPDASVLHTRQVQSGGLPWARRKQIEVTASAAIEAPRRFKELEAAGAQQQGKAEQMAAPPNSSTPQPSEGMADGAEPLWDVEAYRSRVQSVVARDLQSALEPMTELEPVSDFELDLTAHDPPAPTPLAPTQPDVETRSHSNPIIDELSRRLANADFNAEATAELSERVASQLSHDDSWETAVHCLQSCFEEQLTLSGPITVRPDAQRVIALIGPTGVGKTTTIAKLAADFRLREHRRVGLITFDTYRVAAVEQLRTYAEIIDLPMRVVGEVSELETALDEMREMDLVLMDTAGRSPNDEVRIRELKAGLRQAKVDEVHLVLSCIASSRSLQRAAERFQTIGADGLILTKLDEAESFGGLYSLLRESQLPISYVTDGQAVPDDIQVASSRRLAEQMVRGV